MQLEMKRHQKRDILSCLTMMSEPIPACTHEQSLSEIGIPGPTAQKSAAKAHNGKDLDMHQLPFLYELR